MTDFDAQETSRVLDCLRAMPEPQLHTTVLWPLLERMGARYIRYVHGAFERGKDFVYMAQGFYGKYELTVCQAKNEKLSANFSSSSSTGAFLQQALHCVKTEVLNPATSQKETPQRVVLITTYPFPDHALADANHLLVDVHAKCTLIGPEDLADLLRVHMPDFYAECAHPGEGLFRAIRRYVIAHHEAPAFDLPQAGKLGDFFVNLGIGQMQSVLGELISGRLRPVSAMRRTIARSDYMGLRAALDVVAADIDSVGILDDRVTCEEAISNPSSVVEKQRQDYITVHVDMLAFVRDVKNRFRDLQKVLQKARSEDERRTIAAEAISFLRRSDDFSRTMYEFFGEDLFSRNRRSESGWKSPFFLEEIDPASLLQTENDICIVGDAGAGKTCFARMLAQKALNSGLRCAYFPCARMSRNAKSLTGELARFLRSLDEAFEKQTVKSLIEDLDLVVVDGCDEAPGFPDDLARQITALCANRSFAITVCGTRISRPTVPRDLQDLVSCRRTRRGLEIRATNALAEADLFRLIACNRENEFASVFQELAAKIRIAKPRLVITSRTGSRMALPRSFQYLELRPFDDKQMETFFRKWCKLTGGDHREIRQFLNDNPHVKEICRTPLNATIVAALHQNGYDLPRSRVELYQQRFELLLDRWDRVRRVVPRTRINKTDKLRFLSRLAMVMHLKHARRFSSEDAEHIWENGFAGLYPRLAFAEVLAELQHCNSVVFSEGSGHYSLGHLSYQEYLAAYAIAWGQHSELLVTRFLDPWWRQTLVFFAGIAGDVGALLSAIQTQGRLIDCGGLIDEMMAEARYTRPLVRQVIQDLSNVGDLDEESGFGLAENDLGAQEGDDLESDRMAISRRNHKVFGAIQQIQETWQCEATLSCLGGLWFVDIVAGDTGPDDRQVEAFAQVKANENVLRDRLGEAVSGYCSSAGVSSTAMTVDEIWQSITPLVLSIPVQPEASDEHLVEFSFELSWDEDQCLNLRVENLCVVDIQMG